MTSSCLLELAFGGRCADGVPLPFVAVQGNYGPRWLISVPTSRAALALRSWTPYGRSSRLVWSVMRAAASRGFLRYLPRTSVHTVTTDPAGGIGQFGRAGKIEARVVLVGNPSPSRKIIQFLIAADGTICGVVKSPLTAEAKCKLLHEAEILQSIARFDCAPHVVFANSGSGVCGQTWIQGESVGRSLTGDHIAFLLTFPSKAKTATIGNVAEEVLSALAATDYGDLTREAFNVCRGVECEPLPAVLTHGDFAPWNIKRSVSGAFRLLDWESAQPGDIPLQDLCHFFYGQDRLFYERRNVLAAMLASPLVSSYLNALGLSTALLVPLATVYLLRQLRGATRNCDRALTSYVAGQLKSMPACRSKGLKVPAVF